ncbi:MAG: aminotransferase class I/II-fold pyridoxal phosphate-dependent enzyme [Firmicutes bacterium]|nr:aminotransferase class I/II-fold pyridoxal phosphate-dependent enzyme [Bacillota bacterium]
MPGLRIGAAVLNNTLQEQVTNLKHLSDLNTSGLHQAALDIFIKSGLYAKHISKIKSAYTTKLKKAQVIFQALSPPGLNWHVPQHGIFIWLELPTQQAESFSNRLKQLGIIVQSAADCFPEDWVPGTIRVDPAKCIRLCIAEIPDDNLDSFATILKEVKPNYAGGSSVIINNAPQNGHFL